MSECKKHGFELEGCGKCLEDAKYTGREHLFLRALFVLGAACLIANMYLIMEPSIKALNSEAYIRQEFTNALQNYSCTLRPQSGGLARSCVCQGSFYPECSLSACDENGLIKVTFQNRDEDVYPIQTPEYRQQILPNGSLGPKQYKINGTWQAVE